MELPNLTTDAIGRDIVWLEEVDSTNNYVKENAGRLGHLALVIARRQTQGKGRLGRSWQFDPGQSLAMSLLIKNVRPRDLTRLPALFALGVRGGLSGLCGLELGIKWSNDIVWQGKKIAGILCESRSSAQSLTAVGGIGVNLAQTRKELDNHNLLYASSLFLATNKLFSMEEVAGAICNEMERVSLSLFQNGFAPLRDEYRRHCVTLGKQVYVTISGREASGAALDIGEDGSLLCMIDGELVAVTAGEASVRGMMGYAD